MIEPDTPSLKMKTCCMLLLVALASSTMLQTLAIFHLSNPSSWMGKTPNLENFLINWSWSIWHLGRNKDAELYWSARTKLSPLPTEPLSEQWSLTVQNSCRHARCKCWNWHSNSSSQAKTTLPLSNFKILFF